MPASDTSGADEVRILNSISEGKGAARAKSTSQRKPRRSLVIVLVLLVLVGGVAFATFHAMGPESTSTASPSTDQPTPALASNRSTPGASAPATPADPAPANTVDTAVINDTAAPAPEASSAAAPVAAAPRGPDQLTSALEEGVKPPPATLKNALEAKPEKPQKSSAHAATHDDKKKKSARTDPRNDSDVDLIKALVARSAEVERKPAGRDANAGGNTPRQAQNQAAAPARSGDPRNVDVVERKGNESTASLLKRCHALGFLEGEFCRWRICSGRWDTDAACKVSESN